MNAYHKDAEACAKFLESTIKHPPAWMTRDDFNEFARWLMQWELYWLERAVR